MANAETNRNRLSQFDPRPDIDSFLKSTAFSSDETSRLIVELCLELLFLRDEGRELRPTIIFSPSPEVTDSAFGGSSIHDVLFHPQRQIDARLLAKELAPLSSDCWLGLLEIGGTRTAVRLVASPSDVYNRPAAKAFNRCLRKDFLFIETMGTGNLLLRSSKDNTSLRILASPREKTTEFGSGPMEWFMASIYGDGCRGGPPVIERAKFALSDAIQDSHGVIFAVALPGRVEGALQLFKRSTRFSPPIDLAVGERMAKDIGEISEVGAKVLRPVTSSLANADGIVLFGADFCVHAYRCFVDLTRAIPTDSGGARREALNALCASATGTLRGILFRSQDGGLEFTPFPH